MHPPAIPTTSARVLDLHPAGPSWTGLTSSAPQAGLSTTTAVTAPSSTAGSMWETQVHSGPDKHKRKIAVVRSGVVSPAEARAVRHADELVWQSVVVEPGWGWEGVEVREEAGLFGMRHTGEGRVYAYVAGNIHRLPAGPPLAAFRDGHKHIFDREPAMLLLEDEDELPAEVAFVLLVANRVRIALSETKEVRGLWKRAGVANWDNTPTTSLLPGY